MNDFNQTKFQNNVDKALESVNRVLELNRKAESPDNVDHEYDNKYDLADQLTNTAIIACINALREIGLTSEILQSIDKSKPATLRFKTSDSCEFIKQETVKIPTSQAIETDEVIETQNDDNDNEDNNATATTTAATTTSTSKKSSVTKVVKNVVEFHWKVTVQWQIYVFSGNNDEPTTNVVLAKREASQTIITQTDNKPPIPEKTYHPSIDLSLSWLLQQLDMADWSCQFSVNREIAKTPRRNDQIEEAYSFSESLFAWSCKYSHHFTYRVERQILDRNNPAIFDPDGAFRKRLISLPNKSLFCPILPLMEKDNIKNKELDVGTTTNTTTKTYSESSNVLSFAPTSNNDANPTPLLSPRDMHKLLLEQVRSIDECIKEITNSFPPAQNESLFVSITEAKCVLMCLHLSDIMPQYQNGINYIEYMLHKQLVAAIGKEITSNDLDEYIKYHNSKFLSPPPQQFCRTVRRPKHSPDGIVAIERCKLGGDEPITTFVQSIESEEPLAVSINASTTLQLTGEKYLHGWLQHRFSDSNNSFQLSARARQFSSFILVIGTMIGPNELEPKDAIIVQNKDELLIPLLLEELPTAKEFKDAIRSLSPEQQQFAKQYRSMQLSSSVFGICVIQIKPQLERLLGLPDDALTKEMKLTQDLMELFIEYQVPSDLLSFDGPDPTIGLKEKVSNVKEHVNAVMSVIKETKEKQLEEERMRADMDYDMKCRGGSRNSSSEQDWSRMPPEPILDSIGRARAMEDVISWSRAPGGNVDDDYPEPTFIEPIQQLESIEMQRAAEMSNALDWLRSSKEPEMDLDAPADWSRCDKPAPTITTNKIPTSQSNNNVVSSVTIDVTQIPRQLDTKLETRAANSALRSTIIKTSDLWNWTRQENLLTEPKESLLDEDEIKTKKNKAFDLLDALSRSGSLSISCCELHVVIAVTHCFDNTVVGTVVQDNINPIEKLEMSTMLLASTIYGLEEVSQLTIQDAAIKERLEKAFPTLFIEK